MISSISDTFRAALQSISLDHAPENVEAKRKFEECRAAAKVDLAIGIALVTLGSIGSSYGVPFSACIGAYGTIITCYQANKLCQHIEIIGKTQPSQKN